MKLKKKAKKRWCTLTMELYRPKRHVVQTAASSLSFMLQMILMEISFIESLPTRKE
jgi:hypothetical protein